MCPVPTLSRERLAWAEERLLVGVDEAGRGPLAGPVVAAAVVFPPVLKRIAGVRDSKTLPIQRREALALAIRTRAIRLGVGAASSREIDRVNIRVATALAMRRAVARVLGRLSSSHRAARRVDGHREAHWAEAISTDCFAAGAARNDCFEGPGAPFAILLDGLPMPELGFPHEALVDGDALCYSIAAAGIIAKTVRDRLMHALAVRHPGYGWETNMGYCCPAHLAGIAANGVSRHHRMTFAPVAQGELFGRKDGKTEGHRGETEH